jgi:hypothetical protein
LYDLRSNMRIVFFILSFSLSVMTSTPASAGPQAKSDKRTNQLESEKRKLERTKNPADRAKSFMKIAEITLSYVSEAANANDMATMKSFLDQYRQAVNDACDTMMRSGLDPHKKSGGYKAVEIALRKQLRMLQDVGRLLTVDDRAAVDETADVVARSRDQFIHALFGPTNAK